MFKSNDIHAFHIYSQTDLMAQASLPDSSGQANIRASTDSEAEVMPELERVRTPIQGSSEHSSPPSLMVGEGQNGPNENTGITPTNGIAGNTGISPLLTAG